MEETEDRILSECHKWLWNYHPELRYSCWHIANERNHEGVVKKLNEIKQLINNSLAIRLIDELISYLRRSGSIFKSKGVVPGVPDYVINYSGKTYYLEFKTPTGKVSKEQKIVHNALNLNSIEVLIIRSVKDFKEFINGILEQK